jgi:Fe-S-cluster containining protein
MLFTASKGCVARLRDGGRIVRIGTITPRQKPDGRCVFLDQDDRCLIHEVAPFGCAYFDPHMPKAEADKRSAYLAMKQATDREYQELREELVK